MKIEVLKAFFYGPSLGRQPYNPEVDKEPPPPPQARKFADVGEIVNLPEAEALRMIRMRKARTAPEGAKVAKKATKKKATKKAGTNGGEGGGEGGDEGGDGS